MSQFDTSLGNFADIPSPDGSVLVGYDSAANPVYQSPSPSVDLQRQIDSATLRGAKGEDGTANSEGYQTPVSVADVLSNPGSFLSAGSNAVAAATGVPTLPSGAPDLSKIALYLGIGLGALIVVLFVVNKATDKAGL